MVLTLILGNQLHRGWLSDGPLLLGKDDRVLMVEDLGIASTHRYHKLRLLHCFTAMRSFRDNLINEGIDIHYFELTESLETPFLIRLRQEAAKCLGPENIPGLRIAEIADPLFQAEIEDFCKQEGIGLEILPSPAFLSSAAESRQDFSGRKRPFMKRFYEQQRQRLNLLLEADGSPSGGRWSFDTENRLKLPKGYEEPCLPRIKPSPHEPALRQLIEDHFGANPGELGELYVPYDHTAAKDWLASFLGERLANFGPYEDALSLEQDTLQHSLLSPLLNCGLLDPKDVVSACLEHAEKEGIPIASLEGFLRQVIGWREFVRGIDLEFGKRQSESNFWNHHRQLGDCWNDGTTGLPPLDAAIKKVNRLAYNHHIERLMVVSNLMLLCEIAPTEVYGWFMERYIDSYAWVMGPNVYGMGQMSDGGIFATKPYICGSNYILKMGGAKRGPWCEIWDGLYWRFIDRHRSFFRSNPRLSMMVALLDRMDQAKRERLFSLGETFIAKVTRPT